jgi:fructokinase
LKPISRSIMARDALLGWLEFDAGSGIAFILTLYPSSGPAVARMGYAAPMTGSRIFGAVEAGGTKFVCAIGDERGEILALERFPTTHPAATLGAAHAFLRSHARPASSLAAIGVASFGPVELNRRSPRYGFIGHTPKAGWSGTDIAGSFAREFHVPVGFETDVNAAALAEHRWGAARDAQSLVYLTIGTGIGGGVMVDGVPVHGLMHPEIGHIYPRRHSLDQSFAGVCPFHGDCLEGVASGPAILARSGASLDLLDESHPQWTIEADYLGQLCAQLVVTVSPQRIIMGGGVMSQARLLPLIRPRVQHWLNGYIDRPEILTDIGRYVVAPELGDNAGVLGALVLALDAAPRRAPIGT